MATAAAVARARRDAARTRAVPGAMIEIFYQEQDEGIVMTRGVKA
jgi:hypothetical protein